MQIDILVIILLVIAGIKGFQKGLIIAIFSLVGFIIGLAAALKFSTVVAAYLNNHANISAKWLPLLSFALVFIVVVFLVRLGAKLIERTAKLALLGWLNYLGGIAFYSLLYLIILSIFLYYAQMMNIFEPGSFQSSKTYPFIEKLGPWIINHFGEILPVFKNMFNDLTLFFNQFSNKIP
jgi:membrane protein required for colicin V production